MLDSASQVGREDDGCVTDLIGLRHYCSCSQIVVASAVTVAFGLTVAFPVDKHTAQAFEWSTIVVSDSDPSHGGVVDAFGTTEARRSIDRIWRALDSVPIEDGIIHSSEALVVAHISEFGEAFLLDAARSERAAEWIRLLGRTPGLSAYFRRSLVTDGLKNTSVEIRDAVIQAVENWEDRGLVGLLRDHSEQVDWLREYAAGIVRDLEA